MESPPPPVRTNRLTKRFRRVTALNSLNLRLAPGEVLALLGANGSGKSTTFRLLLNIYRPSSGESSLLGTLSTRLNGHDFDKVGYVSEGQKMPKWMSVEGFLNYCSGFYTDWDSTLCDHLVASFGLPKSQRIKHLSRGQAMKVAVASTLPARPNLLLLDEPFSGLDVETRAQLGDLLKSLAHQDGLAIILTTHDVEEVEPVANRIGILSHGRLVVDETLDSYRGRHRLLVAEGLDLSSLPEDLRRRFGYTRALKGGTKIYTEHYSQALEENLKSALLERGIEARFEPMDVRQILTAHSLPVV